MEMGVKYMPSIVFANTFHKTNTGLWTHIKFDFFFRRCGEVTCFFWTNVSRVYYRNSVNILQVVRDFFLVTEELHIEFAFWLRYSNIL